MLLSFHSAQTIQAKQKRFLVWVPCLDHAERLSIGF